MPTNKTILLVAASSSIAKHFKIAAEAKAYQLLCTSRNTSSVNYIHLNLSDNNIDIELTDKLDAIIFFQGLNPQLNTQNTTNEHFINMLNINLVAPTLLFKKLIGNLNSGASIVFLGSIAATKGSYDPAYAAAKAGLIGLMHSLANEFKNFRFNIISLGLVEQSSVYNQMSGDFKEKHRSKMYNQELIQFKNINSMIFEILENTNMNRAIIPLDGGFQL
ncbi:MAG: SDR family oxidoreductase [Sphingobacteriia bacterium]|nr:MAG: SDR family oxidoreductase [Sphingobacteriia bacterium]